MSSVKGVMVDMYKDLVSTEANKVRKQTKIIACKRSYSIQLDK